MIKLEVEPYCHECGAFEADVENPSVFYEGYKPLFVGDTIIRCKNRKLCSYIQTVIKKGDEK